MYTPADVLALPWVRALEPIGMPYLAALSKFSSTQVWHVDVRFEEFTIPTDLLERWRSDKPNNNETWRKRPLAIGRSSGCRYSCGEVELAARLQKAGYEAFWVSEWGGYPHVDMWESVCVKRKELEARVPELWAADHNLRERAESRGVYLGRRGGHPDVGAWKAGSRDFCYVEYKGPNDEVNKKQDGWANALLGETPHRLSYVVAKGRFGALQPPRLTLQQTSRDLVKALGYAPGFVQSGVAELDRYRAKWIRRCQL